MECQFCKKILANKYGLKRHQERTLYCLKIQGVKERERNFSCPKCGKNFSFKHHLEKHLQTCSSREIEYKNVIDQKEKECEQLKSDLKKLKEKHSKVVSRYEKQLQLKETENDDLQDQISDLQKEISILREDLSGEKGKLVGYDRAITNHSLKSKTVNNYVHPKLLHIGVDNIRPFTIETVRQEIEDGKFTREMFDDGKRGILHFVSNMISMTNGEGRLERNYACTDSSRHKFHRLVESKEWKSDNGAHFLNDVLNQLSEPVARYFTETLDRRKKFREVSGLDAEDIMENDAICAYYTQKINALKPIYDGVVRDKGEAREKLFTTLRNKISSIASV